MRKFGIYAFLVAAILVTGCAQKEMEVVDQSQQTSGQSSEAVSSQETTEAEVVSAADEVVDGGVYVTINGERVFLKNVYFAFDKYDITADMRQVIKDNAVSLSKYSGVIRVEGNSDEWGTDEYNFALSLKRAKAVKDALASEGLNADNLKLISYGESNPTCSEATQQCWEKNRRVEFRLNK